MSTVEVSSPGTQVTELVVLVVSEPHELRDQLRHSVGENPISGKTEAVDAVAETLWTCWNGELVERGVDAWSFRSVVEGADHEVWLWVMGDRPYDQLVAALAGRVLRRFHSAPLGDA